MQKCNRCGSDYSGNSMGGPNFCPACDCGYSVERAREMNRPMAFSCQSCTDKDAHIAQLEAQLNEKKQLDESPDKSIPGWKRHYFCPQCSRAAQPSDGYSVIQFVQHTHEHTLAYLREAITDAARYDAAIQELEDVLKNPMTANWPAQAIRQQALLAPVRAYHAHDDAAWEEWKKIREEPK